MRAQETFQDKLHRPVLGKVVSALGEIFVHGRHADKVIESLGRASQPRLGSRDRRLLAESVYDSVRWWRPLWQVTQGSWPPTTDQLQNSQLWQVVGAWLILYKNLETLPQWVEWQDLPPPQTLRARFAGLSEFEQASFPDWLQELAERELGAEAWSQHRQALNSLAPVFLRVNGLKITRGELQQVLAEESVETVVEEKVASALRLKVRAPVFRTEAFKKGYFEVQDLGSQQIAPLLQVEPGHRVVDACAGAGGKSLHLAELMQNRGRIIAMDIHQWKLDELKVRARRAGVSSLETRLIESTKVIKRLRQQADRLLLDVPCTGLGVLRRNPDSKWKLSLSELERLRQLQAQLLQNYSSTLKVGGKMVYATCSLLPSENRLQVKAFLDSQTGGWELEEELELWPEQGGGDGFYGARLRRL